MDRLPALSADLVRRRVAVIATGGGAVPALAAKAATTTIPIVFTAGYDPVGRGLVASLARPGGNLTGINIFVVEVLAKRLELLRELVPGAARVAVLVNPAEAANTEITLRDVDAAARRFGLQVRVLKADTNDRSKAWGENGPRRCSSGSPRSSSPAVSNWSNWRRSTGSPQHIHCVILPKPAG